MRGLESPRDPSRHRRKAFPLNLPDTNAASPAARLADARRKQWHQQGEALLTLENARSFLNAAGLVLFAPRPQIAAPAPSFAEAVLGEPNSAPTVAQGAPARELLAHLVAEGLAVPLNLLGVGTVIGQAAETPDFIVSAQVFSYVFTLRGDKGWKQSPQATGAVKFSNLAIAAYEALAQRGPLSAYDLTGEIGKEVTESAVLRALGELWSHLRVLPLPQLDGRATLWELATARLTKQIKAGANAGQPTALSALLSLYLGQAIVASEDEIESFLSPLAARSRVRDVLHALIAARQLDTVAIEGKTMLHIAGAAPAFLAEEPSPEMGVEGQDVIVSAVAVDASASDASDEDRDRGQLLPAEPGSRIAKFVPRPKDGAKELAKAKPASASRKPFRELGKPFGQRKPLARDDSKGRPPFRDAKPSRPFGERGGFKRSSESAGDAKSRFEKKRFTPRDSDSKPRFERRDREGARPDRGRRPFGGGDRPPRRFAGRDAGAGQERRPFTRSADRRVDAGTRPPRRQFDRSSERAAGRKPFGGQKRDFPPREDRPRDFKPRSFGDQKSFGGARSFGRAKPFGKRDESGEGREESAGARGFGGKRPFAKAGGFGKKPGGFGKPFRSREREGERSGRPERNESGVDERRFGAKRSGGVGKFGGKKFGNSGSKFGPRKFGERSGEGRFGVKKYDSSSRPRKFGSKKPFGKPRGGRGPKPSGAQGES